MRRQSLKKRLALFVALTILVTAFAGCSPQKKPEQQNTDASAKSIMEQALKLPISEKPLKIKMWASLHPNHVSAGVNTFNDIIAFKELEKRTNIVIDWTNASPQNSDEQLKLLFAANDLPDAFLATNKTNGSGVTRTLLSSQGAVMKLNDLLQQYGQDTLKVLKSVPGLWAETVDDQSAVWDIPAYIADVDILGGLFMPMVIRRDWLKKVNMAEPQTQDEWYSVLKAFREKDPNGNGKKDEIPVSGGVNESFAIDAILFNSLGITRGSYQVNGKVMCGELQPEYKKGLQLGAKMVAEGLIDPEFLTQTMQQMEKKILDNLVGASMRRQQIKVTQFKPQLKDKVPDYDMYVTSFVKAPDGKRYSFNTAFTSVNRGLGLYINSKTQYAKEIMQWIDYQYTQEGGILMNYGVEGVSYKTVNGIPVIDESIYNVPGKGFDLSARAKYTIVGNGTSEWPALRFRTEKVNGKWPADAVVSIGDEKLYEDSVRVRQEINSSRIFPAVTFTDKDSEFITQKMTDILPYENEMYAKFLTGVEPLDKFDAFVAQLKKMGIDDVIAIQQASLDRYNKR